MSFCWADKVEAAIFPYMSLNELISDLKEGKQLNEARLAAAAALEAVKHLLEEEE